MYIVHSRRNLKKQVPATSYAEFIPVHIFFYLLHETHEPLYKSMKDTAHNLMRLMMISLYFGIRKAGMAHVFIGKDVPGQ
jgi:hypothetical protein